MEQGPDLFTGGGFTEDDVGKMIYFQAPWYVRVWRWIKRHIFRIKELSNGTYKITEVVDSSSVRIENE